MSEELRRPQVGDLVHIYRRGPEGVTGPHPATVERFKTADFAWNVNCGVTVRMVDTKIVTLACHCPDGSKSHSTTWRWPN